MAEYGKIQKSKADEKFRPSVKLDAELEQELAEALGDASLADLLEEEETADQQEASSAPQHTPEGVHHGKVLAVQGDDIFVDLPGKRQGLLPASQYADDPLPEVGQQVEFTIQGFDRNDGLLILSRQGAVMAATWENLEAGQTVEGKVTGHNKGGLELSINGIDAFMPISQIEQFHVDELEGYLNQKLACRVVEADLDSGKLVVSRRELLDIEAKQKAEELLEALEPGQNISGTVKTIMPYGAFVDIGGIDGLLHVSDMSYTRIDKPEDMVSVGEQVDVVVLQVDHETKRISLGLKQALADPWSEATNKWTVGEVVTGRVVRLAPFGAFVELEPGVDGLVPISELSHERRVHHPRELLAEGDTVSIRVLSIDQAARRISLSIKQAGQDPWMGASVRWPEGSVAQGRVTRTADFGAFVELAPGVEGLVHISELGDGYIRSVSDALRDGDAVTAKVLTVDEDARRISLSIKGLAESPEYTGSENVQQSPPKKDKKAKRPRKGGLD